MAAVASEQEFAAKFEKLISFVCPEPIYSDGYQQELTGDSSNIPAFALPKLKHSVSFSRGGQSKTIKREIKITFKSLRPPKFTKTIQVESELLIHNIKNKLIEELSQSEGLEYQPSQIKIMLKTKTIHDSEQIGNIVDPETNEVSLNVMISKEAAAAAAVATASNSGTPEPITGQRSGSSDPEPMVIDQVDNEFRGLSSDSWSKIYEILKTEIKDTTTRDKYFNSLKSVSI